MRAYFIATNKFSVSGDATDDFTAGRRLISYCGADGTKYSTVSSSALNISNDTEVTIVETNLTTNLERVRYGVVSTGAKGNLPVHDHSATSQGGDNVTPAAHGSTHIDGTDDVPDFVGDAGAGGTHGLVPAPAAGDSGAVLGGDGNWVLAPMTTDELKRMIWIYSPVDRTKYTDSEAILAVRAASWIQGDGYYIGTDQIRARDGDGLLLTDDAGNGIFIEDGGNVRLLYDNHKLLFGTGKDASIYYDGTNLIVKPQEVGAGRVRVFSPFSLESQPSLLATPVAGTLEFYNDRVYLTNVGSQKAIDRTSCVETSTTTVSDTITETTIYTCPEPADSMKVGNYVEVRASGVISNASASDDITINIYVGATLIETYNPAVGNVTGADWHVDFSMTVRAVGATGSIAAHGHVEIDGNSDDVNEIETIDTTVANDITVTVQWDNASVSNTISLYQGVAHWSN